MNKKFGVVIATVLLSISFLLTGCSDTKEQENDSKNTTKEINEVTNPPEQEQSDQVVDDSQQTEDFSEVELTAGGWSIILENTMRDASMSNAAVVLGYTDTTTNEFVQEAPEGKEYFLVKMKITKNDSSEYIQWDKLTLKDSDNNVYTRADDIFIEDLGMKRMPGTDLNFGSNEGWIAFEINKGAEELQLQYQFDNENLEYTFS